MHIMQVAKNAKEQVIWMRQEGCLAGGITEIAGIVIIGGFNRKLWGMRQCRRWRKVGQGTRHQLLLQL